MNRQGRLQSGRLWLTTQRGRPPERIARSYRKRYGVDWVCAIAELSALGLAFDPKWREQLDLALEGAKRAKARRLEEQKTARARLEFSDFDENFAFIADHTEGGVPFGVTWEEWAQIERGEPRTPIAKPLKTDPPEQCDDESLPF